MPESTLSPLEQLSTASGRSFPNLLQARRLTQERLETRRTDLAKLPHDDDVSIVLMGSWGRAEVTSGSDDDYMILVKGKKREDIHPSIAELATILDCAPSDQGPFGEPVFSHRLIKRIGLEKDSNNNLSRRMLFLLESVYATDQGIYDSVKTELIARYLDVSVSDYQPPRFLLNDVIRYWRTICVDFAGKEHEGPNKWGIRNAKLRTARKILFAGGLLPVFECARLEKQQMTAFPASATCDGTDGQDRRSIPQAWRR